MSARAVAAATTIAAILHAGPVCAADYTVVFASGSAKFAADQGGNAKTLAAIASLLRNHGASHSIDFVLVGELPAECSASPDCPASLLLRQRVEAVTAQLMAQPATGSLVAQLRWQSIPPATPHVEGLQLRTVSASPRAFSDRCSYQLEIADPSLPPPLSGATGAPSWIAVQGPGTVHITGDALLRVSSSTVQKSAPATLTALESLQDHDVVLSSGSPQAQWTAMQLQWEADGADVVVEDSSQPRDIGDVVLPWDAQPSTPRAPAAELGCHMHFVLSQ